MPSLFLISGYLLFSRFDMSRWPQKMMNRVRRLLVPYLCWNAFFVVFFLALQGVFPRLATRVSRFGLDSVGGAFAKIASLTVHPIDGPLWFLRTLLVFSLCAPLLWLFLRSRKLRYAGLALLVGLGLTTIVFKVEDNLSMRYPIFGILTFYSGGLLAMEGAELRQFFSRWWGLILPIVGLGLNVANVYGWFSFPGLDTFAALCKTSLVFYVVVRLNLTALVQRKWFAFAKDMSFFVYAAHFLICSMWLHVTAPYFANWTTGKTTVLIAVFGLAGTPSIALVWWLARRVCPQTLKLFDGTL